MQDHRKPGNRITPSCTAGTESSSRTRDKVAALGWGELGDRCNGVGAGGEPPPFPKSTGAPPWLVCVTSPDHVTQ